jgi:hypothetical protein
MAKPGRPPRADTASHALVQFRLTGQEKAVLREVARECRMPLTAMVREAILEHVADLQERRAARDGRKG